MSRIRPTIAEDSAAERWSRVYVDVRASYGRASIQSALLLNGGASIALLAFLGNLAIAQQNKGLTGSFLTLKESFVWGYVGRQQQRRRLPHPGFFNCASKRG